MTIKYRLYTSCFLFFFSGLILFAIGCKKDATINRLPDIVITPNTVTEKLIGDVLIISPEVSYGGQEAPLEYKWYKQIQLTASLSGYKLLSKEKVLTYTLDSLGTLNLKLDVTNGTTGVTATSLTSLNVTSRAERGWYILKGLTDGNSDMDAFFTTAAGSQTNLNIFTAKNGRPMSGGPVALGFTGFYTWYNPVTKAFVNTNSCLMPVSNKEIMSYRIRDEKVLANTDQLFFVPPTGGYNFQALVCDPNLMVLVNNGQALGMNPNANSFLPERSGDYSLSPYFTVAPYLYNNSNLGYVLGFDQKTKSFVSVRYKQTDISFFPNTYLSAGGTYAYPYNISSNSMGGQLIFLENTDGTLDNVLSSNGRAYGLLRKDNSTDLMLVGLNTELVIPARYSNGNYSPVAFRTDLTVAAYPDLATASLFAMNKNNPTLYFAKAGTIGAYNIDTKVYNSLLYSFPAGEEISFIKFIDAQYDATTANNFRNLVVATYANGRYKVYRFIVLGNTLTQTGSLMEGAGRVKSLIYTAPNGTSTATYTSFSNAMYRYY